MTRCWKRREHSKELRRVEVFDPKVKSSAVRTQGKYKAMRTRLTVEPDPTKTTQTNTLHQMHFTLLTFPKVKEKKSLKLLV